MIPTDIKLINVGFGNIISVNRIVAVVNPESAPIKRVVQEAKDHGRLIDATQGRRKRSVIICDSDHVILSALQPETVAGRITDDEKKSADKFTDNDLSDANGC